MVTESCPEMRTLTPTGRAIVGGTVIAFAAIALFALIVTGAWQQ